MRHLLFLFMCDFILLRGNMNDPRYGLLARFAFWMKGLKCALNTQLHSLRASPLIKAIFFVMYEMACVFKARINLQSNPNCNLNKVTGFYIYMLSYTRESRSRTSYAYNFKRLSDTNLRVLRTFFWLCCLWFFSWLWFKLWKCNRNKALNNFDTRWLA